MIFLWSEEVWISEIPKRHTLHHDGTQMSTRRTRCLSGMCDVRWGGSVSGARAGNTAPQRLKQSLQTLAIGVIIPFTTVKGYIDLYEIWCSIMMFPYVSHWHCCLMGWIMVSIQCSGGVSKAVSENHMSSLEWCLFTTCKSVITPHLWQFVE